ncbi:MAG TPA: NUDIX domain-containing protein [Longimicrobiaceae bacterium]|jgi:ADP-ribose pyrophosphatase YjhB (NUDIX family)|nr:NUDIX domain-containing protein [Longimicrobiaceae bacterium]
MMASDLAAFLSRHKPLGETTAAWGNGTIPLRVTGYLSQEAPPDEYVTSVRCVVFKGDDVLVMRDAEGRHLLPGGQREPGETLDETLRRELLEETGWMIDTPLPIGFVHLHHLGPRPPDFESAYPDFLWAIYTAEAVVFEPGVKLSDEGELEATFHPLTEIANLALPEESLLYLEAAIKARAPQRVASSE